MIRLSLSPFFAVVLSVHTAFAAEGDAAKPTKPSDETAAAAPAVANPLKGELVDVQTAYCEAYNKGDAKSLAALFTADADWIDDQGTVIRGRAAIQRALQDALGGQKDRS